MEWIGFGFDLDLIWIEIGVFKNFMECAHSPCNGNHFSSIYYYKQVANFFFGTSECYNILESVGVLYNLQFVGESIHLFTRVQVVVHAHTHTYTCCGGCPAF